MPFAGASDAAIYNATINKVQPSLRDSNDQIPTELTISSDARWRRIGPCVTRLFGVTRRSKNILRESQTDSFDNAATRISMRPIKTTELAVSKPRRTTSRLIAPLLILLLAIVVYWKYFYVQNSAVSHFQSIKLDVLTAHGLATSVAISPDGKYIAYAKNDDGKESLWLRQTASGRYSDRSAHSNKYDFLTFSRDGNFLYFVGSEGAGQPSSLYQITTLGRNQRKLITGVDSQISFSPDGTR